jgi:hypothetical protein
MKYKNENATIIRTQLVTYEKLLNALRVLLLSLLFNRSNPNCSSRPMKEAFRMSFVYFVKTRCLSDKAV